MTCRLCFLRESNSICRISKNWCFFPRTLFDTIPLVALSFHNFRIHHLVLNDLGSTSLHVYKINMCMQIWVKTFSIMVGMTDSELRNATQTPVGSELKMAASNQPNSWRSKPLTWDLLSIHLHWARSHLSHYAKFHQYVFVFSHVLPNHYA